MIAQQGRHDIVTTSDDIRQTNAGTDQFLSVAAPYVGTMGQTGNLHQFREDMRPCLFNGISGIQGTKFRQTGCAGFFFIVWIDDIQGLG